MKDPDDDIPKVNEDEPVDKEFLRHIEDDVSEEDDADQEAEDLGPTPYPAA